MPLANGAGGTLTGGLGADSFVFTSPAVGGETIDFSLADGDRILVSASGFKDGLVGGPLAPELFVLGLVAADENDRFIYDQTTGQLFYDADGFDPGLAVLFATLTGMPALTADDIFVIG